MESRFLDLGTCVCRLNASNEIHVAVHHYVSPFLLSAGESEPHMTITVARDAATVAEARKSLAQHPPTTTRTSHPEQRYHAWLTEDREILLPENSADHVIIRTAGLVLIAAEHAHVAATVGTRVVRQLIMRGGEVRGGRCVHAAAVDIDGQGVLIAGQSGSGKTTVFTHLIEDHGAHPVSNDRTVLNPTETWQWNATGVPLSARFTPEGISGSPTLTTALKRYEPNRGRYLVDGKLELTPWEISTLFDRRVLPVTEVAQLVILTRSAQASAAEDDGNFLREHLDFGAEDFFADDWLNLGSDLSKALPGSNVGADGLWERLARTVPVHSMAWTDPAELPAIAARTYKQARL
ncbi:hypothetical protein HUO13_33345 [Saccharopolyspora erythraea]|uniref:hypothetical protein n=1 Tax=Saccharopolyspora erythraea TaxID=1836 RepID=UPI001BAB39C1|nr:hypothetical protein [Saccharopolyspora erythraea]QUH05018.1 hypothetical protein HUO13_33345 [Saccharopolyspora erythraea]